MAEERYQKHILTLAEQCDWDGVLALLQKYPDLALAQDDFGMLPLHWACTDTSIALDVVERIIDICPESCQTESLSGMTPLHVAISSKLPGLHIKAILKVYPDAVYRKDASGRYPIEIAEEKHLPKFTLDIIRQTGSPILSSPSAPPSLSFSSKSLTYEDTCPPSPSSSIRKAQSLSSLLSTKQAAKYRALLDANTSAVESAFTSKEDTQELSTQLKAILSQLHELSITLQSSTSPSASAYGSSGSFDLSMSMPSMMDNHAVKTVLWNPKNRLGLKFEAQTNEKRGAKIRQISSRSSILGVEELKVGDTLVSINGTSVLNTSFDSITRFVKNSKVTCKLRFTSDTIDLNAMRNVANNTTLLRQSNYTNQWGISSDNTMNTDTILYSRLVELLHSTLVKVEQVEDRLKLSSVASSIYS